MGQAVKLLEPLRPLPEPGLGGIDPIWLTQVCPAGGRTVRSRLAGAPTTGLHAGRPGNQVKILAQAVGAAEEPVFSPLRATRCNFRRGFFTHHSLAQHFLNALHQLVPVYEKKVW